MPSTEELLAAARVQLQTNGREMGAALKAANDQRDKIRSEANARAAELKSRAAEQQV